MFAIYLALAGCQLFMRPITGLADNGDFPKVLAHLDVCDPNPQYGILQYVRPEYIISPRCHWESRLTSSETLFVRVIKQVADWTGEESFSISAAGAAHLCVMLASLTILLWTLHAGPPVFRFAIPPFAILVFSDVLYVSYLNSFYMDAASMVFVLLTAVLATAAILRPRAWMPIAFAGAGALLALSKTQHVITAFLFAGLAAWFACRGFRERQLRAAISWTASAVAILAAGVVTLVLAPEDYKAEPFYSVIFYNLVPAAHDKVAKAAALGELGLPASDLPLAGTHAYSPGSPVTQPAWRADFIQRIGYASLVAYYLRHPAVAWPILRRGLTYFAAAMRPGDLANYQREDGFPPGMLAQRFAWWSHLRAWLIWVFPAHLLAFLGLMGIGALLCVWSSKWCARWPIYPLALIVAIAVVLEFVLAVLFDATETARHLFFFHVLTEILMVCGLAAALSLVKR